MKKDNAEKSNLFKDAFILLIITLLAGLSLGFIYELTKGPIEEQEMAIKLEAYEVVYKDAKAIKVDEELMAKAEETELEDLNKDYKNILIEEVNRVYDENDQFIGYILVIRTAEGYGGDISLALGYSLEGKSTGMEVLSMTETPDLGSKINEDEFKSQFIDRQVEEFVTDQSSSSSEEGIDMITGATVSSEAVIKAVNAAIKFLSQYSSEIGGN